MDWFLIIVVAAVILLTIALSLYLIVIYQHPEDDNQAWFPKLVVLLGLCVSIWTVLLFPLDVANEQSCTLDIPLTDCEFTFPMRTMWEALYIANMLLVFVFIPFTLFFYESDSEWCAARPALLSVQAAMHAGPGGGRGEGCPHCCSLCALQATSQAVDQRPAVDPGRDGHRQRPNRHSLRFCRLRQI